MAVPGLHPTLKLPPNLSNTTPDLPIPPFPALLECECSLDPLLVCGLWPAEVCGLAFELEDPLSLDLFRFASRGSQVPGLVDRLELEEPSTVHGSCPSGVLAAAGNFAFVRCGDFEPPRVGVVEDAPRDSSYLDIASERSAALVDTTVRACSLSSRESVPEGEDTTICNAKRMNKRTVQTEMRKERDRKRPDEAAASCLLSETRKIKGHGGTEGYR